jgi:hypothetical protein
VGHQGRVLADQSGSGHPVRVPVTEVGEQLAGRRAERNPGRFADRPGQHQVEEESHARGVAVQQRLFLVGEVVGEGAPGHACGVGDRLAGDPVDAALEGEPHGCLVQRLAGGGLLLVPHADHDGHRGTG